MLESIPRPIFYKMIVDFEPSDLHNLLCVSRFFNRRINCEIFWNRQIELKKRIFITQYPHLSDIDASLLAAARLGLTSYVQKFINQGADVNVKLRYKDKDIFFYPIDHAALSGIMSCVNLLVKNDAIIHPVEPWLYSNSPIHFVAASGSVECVKYFLDLGVPINQNTYISPFGFLVSSLQIAAARNHVQVCQLLLKHGVNIDYCGGQDYRPIHHAMEGGIDCLRLLIKAGAKVNVFTTEGKSPLCLALTSDDDKCVKLLLEHGANPRHVYREQGFYPPLQVAMSTRCYRAAAALLEYDSSLIDYVYTKEGAILPLGDRTALQLYFVI